MPFKYSWQTYFCSLLTFAVAVLVCAVLWGCHVTPGPTPFFASDLRPSGFPTNTLGRIVGSFSDVSFLSNDLLLVTINTRSYGADDQGASDLPESKLLLFDVSRRSLLNTVRMPVEKTKDSVQSAGNGSFVLLNRAGVRICTPNLECGPAVRARGPLYLSPLGTRIAVGGRGRIEQKILDGSSLAELQSFGTNEPKVIPGDNALLYSLDAKLYVKSADKPQPKFLLDSVGTGIWPDARFLSGDAIAALQREKDMIIAKVDGKTVTRVPVSAGSYVAEVSTTAAQTRFCFHDAGYTGLSSLLNFFKLEQPFNLERVSVRDIASGKLLFRLRWDPRPYVPTLTRPSLSPDGHRVALIRHGFLEVYEIH